MRGHRLAIRAAAALLVSIAALRSPPDSAARAFGTCSICIHGTVCQALNPKWWCDEHCPEYDGEHVTCNNNWTTCDGAHIFCWDIAS